MPKSASAATKALAEAVAIERARSGSVSMCRACGVTATQTDPVKCTVCGASDFEVISQEMIERIAEVEGGLQEETTYDGRKLRWTEDARKGLWTMKNAYQRRRVKARVEKSARMKKLDAITLEFARRVIEEETGTPLDIQPSSANPQVPTPNSQRPTPNSQLPTSNSQLPTPEARLIARDERKNPLISTFDWTSEAAQRILRVPAGFMRTKTQERIEELARERATATIDLGLVEEGIEIGKKMMAEMIAGYSAPGGGSGGAATTGSSNAGAGAAPAAPGSNGSGYLNEVRSR
jgi:hypothetical protein